MLCSTSDVLESEHPFGEISTRFTVILSVDAAYHFHPSRKLFLQQAARHADRVGLVDLVFDTRWRYKRWLATVISHVCQIPSANVRTLDELVTDVKAAGFASILSCERIGRNVFPGFRQYTESHLSWRSPYAITGRAVHILYRLGVMDMVVIAASKAHSEPRQT
jgi:hypothetical protein